MPARTPRSSLQALLPLAAAASLALTAAPAAAAGPVGSEPPDPAVWGDLTKAYAATERYVWEPYALNDGWQPDTFCMKDPKGGGAMGIHYWKPENIGSTDPSRPAALLYEDDPRTGERELVGAEWLVPDKDGDLTTAQDRPTIFGQQFNGPMPGHKPGQPVHYDLHVWLWKDNPDGTYKTWNPTVTCKPGSTTPPH
ncbi:hypothetical protein [Streptomyces sp. NPDC093225]|uniref:hypothetical protein n=1 Tax=Streptomyces sp. NPDC093225 TaxID=3366034 RepID=UPI0037FF1CDC